MCFFAANPSSAFAAPPTITSLFPAGAQRGTSTEVTAAGAFDKWPVKVWASGAGVAVEPGKDKGKLTVRVAADAAPGVYWLRPHTEDGAGALRPFVVGVLPEVTEKEPNDDPAKPQVLDRPSVVVNGKLAKNGDVDCFAVSLMKGQTLVAAVEANRTLRSPMDGVLQVVSTDGFVLARNNDFHGLDPQLAFTAPKDGTYLVRVFAFPATPDASIHFTGADTYIYRLTLTTGGFADYPIPLAVSRAAPGAVDVVGWNIPDAARKLPVPPPAPVDDAARLLVPGIANPVRVLVEPHPVLAAPVSGGAPAPFSLTGKIDAPGGVAECVVAGRKGVALPVQVESRSLGLPVNPVVRVLDAGHKQLARAEPGKLHGDTTLSFTPPADGPYTVAVSDLYGGGGSRFVFLLRVLTPEPDYDLSVAADRFTVPPGKSVDVPVKIARRGGFALPVEVAAEGLPDGVKLEIKPPAGKADPNTVTVTLTAADKAGPAGAFRLVGRVKDQPRLTRTARAALPEFEDTTADLWVTVTDVAPAPPPPKKKR